MYQVIQFHLQSKVLGFYNSYEEAKGSIKRDLIRIEIENKFGFQVTTLFSYGGRYEIWELEKR